MNILDLYSPTPSGRGEGYGQVYYFRLGTQREQNQNQNDLLSYAGSWKEMRNEVFDDYMLDIKKRRKKAFSGRRNNETSVEIKDNLWLLQEISKKQ